jgi:hypothetical protein
MRYTRHIFATFVLAATTLTCLAQTSASAAAAPASAEPKVMRWQPGGAVEAVAQDQMKVLTTGGLKLAVTVVDLWKDTTAVRLQLTNTGQTEVATPLSAFSLEVVKPKNESVAPVDAEKMGKKIKDRADSESQSVDYMTRDRSANSGAEMAANTRSQMAAEAWAKDKYLKESAFPASVQPRYQTIGHIFFPYLKKRDAVLVRIVVGDITFEFPFEKNEIHAGLKEK